MLRLAHIARLTPLAAAALLNTACTDDPTAPGLRPGGARASRAESAVRRESIAVSPDTARVVVGRTTELRAVVRDTAGVPAESRVVRWASSDTAVARVDSVGVVTGVAVGVAKITATSDSLVATAAVSVHDASVYRVAVAPRALTVVAGDTLTLAATPLDAGDRVVPERTIHWSSSDTNVVAVDSATGAITALKGGDAWVVARDGAVADSAAVIVVPEVAGVRVIPALDTLEALEETRQMHAVYVDSAGRVITHGPAIARRTIRWSSSDTAIAQVDSVTGVLRGLDRGTVTISARSDTLVGTAKRVIVIKYRSITIGSDHGCNLASGGIAWCWGRNGRQGMIGLDKLEEKEISTVPVRIRGNHRFKSLTTYGTTTCGLTPEGKAWCWGYNGWGVLGTGSSSPGQSPVPVAVKGGITFRSLSAGETHVCGVATDDKAYCWGYGQWYQFGNDNSRSSPEPVRAASDSLLAWIAAGSDATCGIARNGDAYCWGWNGAGQDGSGTKPTNGNTYTKTPGRVVGGLKFRALSNSDGYTCGIDVNDRAHCWGVNGMLGNGATANSSTPLPIAGDLKVRSISAGKVHACVVTTNDEAWCWGANKQGQLGVAIANGSVRPIRAAGELKFAEISAANVSVGFAAFTCGISADRLTTYCWGRGDFGQLGNGTTIPEAAINITPTTVVGQKAAPIEK
jgi:alpha-tubulin suppressor-like RCC1 family protein